MSSSIKRNFYRMARAVGLFALARWATRKRLLILAYHGFALDDEAKFRSKLFINRDTFERRLDKLVRGGSQVLPLGTALKQLRAGTLKPGSVVITIDDGYATTLSIAGPLLHARRLPALVYLTSYHMQKQTPVFDLVVAYLLWRTERTTMTLVWPEPSGRQDFNLSDPTSKARAIDRLVELGHALQSEAERVRLCAALAQALGVDLNASVAMQAFRLMSPEEVRRLLSMDLEIGLHTHRHRFPPDDLDICVREIQDNRAYLQREVGVDSPHFCYPSGVYSTEQWALLERSGVQSATTCDTGMVQATDSVFGLRRFLDGESVHDIEFEAELSGFAELLRRGLRVNRHAEGAQRP